MKRNPQKRSAARARLIADALKRARERRDVSIRKLADRAAGSSPATVWRIENPGEAPGSPSVDTLEALADALETSLCELLGEDPNIEYRSEWPDALRDVLEERGGFVTPTEHAFIAAKLREWPANLLDENTKRETLENRDFWKTELDRLQDSRRWKIVSRLINDAGLDAQPGVLAALESVLALSISTEVLAFGPEKLETTARRPQRCAGETKTGSRCKRTAVPGSDRCFQHDKQTSTNHKNEGGE